MSIDTMAFILGGLLIAIALLGGGLEIRELKIPSVDRIGRLLCFLVGAVFVGVAIFLHVRNKEPHTPPVAEAPEARPTAAPAPRQTPTPAPRSAPTTAPEQAPLPTPRETPPARSEQNAEGEWLTSSQYQQAVSQRYRDGFYPGKVEGRCESGGERFHAQWKSIPLGARIHSNHGLTKEAYDSRNQEYRSQGFALESVSRFRDCAGTVRYQATWIRN